MFKLINKLKNRKGFTLVELIVVLAVLGVIMAIAVPRFTGVQDKAQEDADKLTLQMIAKAAELYYVQEDKTDSITADELVTEYLDSIEFKTDAYGDSDGKDLNITYSDGVVTIKKGTETLFPED